MKTLAIACACFTGFVIWQDLNSSFSASVKLGNIWYVAHPNSLHVSEAIISRISTRADLLLLSIAHPFYGIR